MTVLESAIELAVKAHKGQTDKAGKAYILHPLRVMLTLQEEKAQVVGVLHDVLEDTWVTEADLRAIGCDDDVINGVKAVTRNEGETYEEFVRRAKRDPIGRKVKIADIKDNSDLSRIPSPTARDIARTEKYTRALEVLQTSEEAHQ